MIAERRPDMILALVRFLACGFYVMPLLRFIVFKITSMALPNSALNAAFLLALLCGAVLSSKALRISKAGLVVIFLLIVQIFLFIVSGVYRKSGFDGSDLATAWVYFVSPALFVVSGAFFSNTAARELDVETVSRRTKYWLKVALYSLLLGAVINLIDIVRLGEGYTTAYENFATAPPAVFGGVTLPRVSGAYFSGLDFSLAIVVLLALQRYSGIGIRRSAIICLYLLTALTFTRNAYVLLAIWFFLRKSASGRVARLSSLAYLLGPFLSVLTVVALLAQAAAGRLEVNAETSSMFTRVASWMSIYQQFSVNPSALLVGLGLTQNALVPGDTDVYAIDNFYLELLCYAGLVAYVGYGYLFRIIRRAALRAENGTGNIALMLLLFIPIMGVFNNMVGSMPCSALFFIFGLLAIKSRPEL